MKNLIILGFLLTLSSISLAQGCNGFNKSKRCTRYAGGEYKTYGQSQNALLMADSTYRCQVVLFGNKEYRISFCSENGFSPIHIRLIDVATKEVTYDNETDQYIESVGFTVEKTRQVMIEVTLMPKNKNWENIRQATSCLGILIQWDKMPKIGF